MSLTRWEDPFAGMTSLHQQIDDMFTSLLGSTQRMPTLNAPLTDVYTEDDKQLVTEVHVPGFGKDDVNVSVHDGMLEIKGEKKTEEKSDKKRSYMLRQSTSSFYRRIALPKNADADNVEAHFEDGTLKVVVPFKQLPEPKRIQISAGKK